MTHKRHERKTYAPAHRAQPVRSGATVYATVPGEGITALTCDGTRYGFTSPVAIRQRADGTTIYFIESETFKGRYFGLYQQGGSWILVGESDDSISRTHKRHCISKVEAFQATQQAEAVEELAPETPVPAALSLASVRIDHEELAERRARKLAAMRQEAFEQVAARVRAIETRWCQEVA